MRTIAISIILLTHLGSLFGQKTYGKSDSLIGLLKTANNDTGRVRILNAIAESFIQTDIYDSATFYANQARKLAEGLNFKAGEGAALRIVGISYTCQGEYSKSLTYLFGALKIGEDLKDAYLIGKAYNSLGSNFSLQEDYHNALNYFFKSLSFHYNPVIYTDIARAYRLQNRNRLAIDYYQMALSVDIPEIEKPYILNDLGDIFEQEGNLDSALFYYCQALKIAHNLKNASALCDVNASLGQLYMKKKLYNKSIFYQLSSLEIANQINSKYAIWQSRKSLSETYELMGDGNAALKYYKGYISLRDSIFNEQNIKEKIRLEMNFDFSKKQALQKAEQESKDALTKSELKNQRNQRNGFIVGMSIVIVFSIFLFRSFKQTKKANIIIEEQKKILEHKGKELTDNLNYASRIQKAMITSDDYIKNNLPEHLIISRAKDIVSGDWYWAHRINNDIFFACVDNTGHGASGSLLSMISISLLNEIVVGRHILQPDLVLNELRTSIINSLNQEGNNDERKDGMDISFCRLSLDTFVLEVASANNSILVIRDQQAIELKADRFPCGKYVGDEKPFTLKSMQLQKSDIIFTLTDGYIDQFGKETGKKLMMKRFKTWTCELATLEMPQIKMELEFRFDNWIQDIEQIDDVTVFAVKV